MGSKGFRGKKYKRVFDHEPKRKQKHFRHLVTLSVYSNVTKFLRKPEKASGKTSEFQRSSIKLFLNKVRTYTKGIQPIN